MHLTDDAKLVVEAAGPQHERSQVEDAAVRLARAFMEAADEREGGCRYCGAAAASAHGWECGTFLQFGGHTSRSWTCSDRQIARLTARLAALTDDVREAKDIVAELMDGADEAWAETVYGARQMSRASEFFQRKAGCE